MKLCSAIYSVKLNLSIIKTLETQGINCFALCYTFPNTLKKPQYHSCTFVHIRVLEKLIRVCTISYQCLWFSIFCSAEDNGDLGDIGDKLFCAVILFPNPLIPFVYIRAYACPFLKIHPCIHICVLEKQQIHVHTIFYSCVKKNTNIP